jgi:nitrate reductase delta subunit
MSDPTNMPTRSEPERASHPALEDTRAGHAVKCLARARCARFLAELFGVDDAGLFEQLGDELLYHELLLAASVLSIDEANLRPLFADRPPFGDVLDARNRLLGHTVRSACPPYELEYGQAEVFQQSQRLADIAGFYAAFGFETAGLVAERPDHVVAQWEFLFVLALREAQALADDRLEDAASCHTAQRLFLKDHAATWMPAFFERIRRAEPPAFFLTAAKVADRVLGEWCAALAVPMGARWIELRPISDEDSTITCGAPGEGTVELGPTLAAAMAER